MNYFLIATKLPNRSVTSTCQSYGKNNNRMHPVFQLDFIFEPLYNIVFTVVLLYIKMPMNLDFVDSGAPISILYKKGQ